MMLGCRSDLRISLVDGKLGKLLAIKGPLFIHMSYVVRYHSEVHDCMPMYPLLYLYIVNMIIIRPKNNDAFKVPRIDKAATHTFISYGIASF